MGVDGQATVRGVSFTVSARDAAVVAPCGWRVSRVETGAWGHLTYCYARMVSTSARGAFATRILYLLVPARAVKVITRVRSIARPCYDRLRLR